MPADGNLLLSMGLDLSPVKSAADTIKTVLNGLNDLANQVKSAATGAAADQNVQMKELRTQAENAVQTAKSAITQDNARAEALKTQTSELQRQAVVQTSVTAAAQAYTAELQRQTEELRKQAEIRNRRRPSEPESRGGSEHKEGGEGEGGIGGALAGLGGNVVKGVLGSGLAGNIAGGVLAGAGIVSLIEIAGESLEEFLGELKKVTVEAGKLTILEDIFKGLAAGAGINATELIEKMSVATQGLVSKLTLLKIANTELRSPLHLTADQMAQLAGDVTQLALAAGHTAEEGMDALNQAILTGRTQRLSMVLDMQGLRDIMRDIPPGLNETARSTLILTRTFAALRDQAAGLGTLPTTIQMLMQKIEVAVGNLEEGFGQGLGQSAGMQKLLDVTGELVRRIGGMEGLAKRVGEALGDAFGKIASAIQLVSDHADTLKRVFNDLLDLALAGAFVKISVEIFKAGEALLAFIKNIGIVIPMIESLKDALAALELVTGASRAGIYGIVAALAALAAYKGLDAWKDHISAALGETATWSDMLHASLMKLQYAANGFSISMKDAVAQVQAMRDQAENLQRIIALSGQDLSKINPFGKVINQKKPSDQPTPQERLREAQAEMQDQIAQAQLALQAKKDDIANRKALDEQAYKYEQEALEQHYAVMRQIEEDNYQASKTAAEKEFEAKKDELDKQRKIEPQVITDTVYQDKLDVMTAAMNKQILDADRARNLAELQLENEHLQDMKEARQKAIDGQLKQQQDQIARQQKALQAGLQQGEIDPDTYFQKQIALTQQLAEAKIDAANLVYANSEHNADTLRNRAEAINAAVDEAEDKLQQMSIQEAQVRLQYVQRQFQPQQQAIEDQIGAVQPGQNPAALQEQMAKLLASQREALEQQIAQLTPLSNGWFQVYSQIEKVYQMQQKYNDELRKSQDMMQPFAQGLQSVNGLIDAIWTSKFVKGLSAGLSGGIAAVKGSTDAGIQIRNAISPGSSTVSEDPYMRELEAAAQQASTSFGGVDTAAGRLVSSLGNLATAIETATGKISSQAAQPFPEPQFDANGNATLPDSEAVIGGTQRLQNAPVSLQNVGSLPGQQDVLQQFTSGLTAAVGELTNFADALSKSTTKVGGAISGAVGGVGLGNTAATALKPFLSSTMDEMLPLIGGAIGSVVGMITGGKNETMTSELSQLNSQYTSIMDAFHANTDNLQEAITQMQNLISEAAVDEANSKKGGSQFASLISQYSQQLSQLQDQQSSIISGMEVQLSIFSTATGMQQFLTNLSSIIDQYDKFAGAAQNASQLAQANSWLTDSLSSYTTQMENTFMQDEENGIQDALSLNSLLSERSTLLSSLNTSIENVLEQGVLTRQQTTAQTKGQQIEALETQGSSQLTSIDQEISLEQYKVSVETSLYNLAMTSMGLQAQLLSLQENQASQSLAAIGALQTLINTLQSGSYDFGSLSSILVALGYTGAAGNLPVSTLSTVPMAVHNNTNAMDSLVAAAYQSRATLGYGSYRGSNI